jgi:pimeloyl-ACP methyl ester carboxylesterase
MFRFFNPIALVALLLFSTGIAAAEERWLTLPEPAAMPAPAETGYAPVNGIQMYYAVYGAGDPVLLIHGGLGHADIWASQVATMSKTHKVIVADSRGHGRSTRNADPYGYDLMASDYLALLDFLKIDKTALVGWSDGGIIGIDIALSHPERLTRLYAQAANVTVDGVDPGVATNKTFGAYIERMGRDYRRCRRRPTNTTPSSPRSAICGKANRTGPRNSSPRSPRRRPSSRAITTRRSSASTPNTWPPSFRAPS